VTDSEQEWLDLARNGDDEAFSRLVETYQAPVYNLCYRMLGESTAAEDATQETFGALIRTSRNTIQHAPSSPGFSRLQPIFVSISNASVSCPFSS